MKLLPCKLEVPLSPLVAEAAAEAAAAAAASAILMAFLVLALLAAAEATVVPEAVFMTAEAPPAPAAAGADSPSLESLESPPGRLARLLVDLHLLRQARLLLMSWNSLMIYIWP